MGGVFTYLSIYIYIYVIRPICRLRFGPKSNVYPVYSQKGPPKNGLQNVPKMHFLLSLILVRFPPKKAKCVVSSRKSRQHVGLKAYMAIMYIYMYVCVSCPMAYGLEVLCLNGMAEDWACSGSPQRSQQQRRIRDSESVFLSIRPVKSNQVKGN